MRNQADETGAGVSPVVLRHKRFTADPISVDDALYRMELVGHDFYLFVDVATGLPSVVYKRVGWNYGVIALGAPYMSREWFEARRPYAWSTFPDCTAVAENSAPYTNRRLLGREATHAEGDLRGRSRTMAVVAPNNLEYQQCVDTFVEGLRAEGNDLAERLDYTIDIATLPATAASLISKLKSEEITTVSCAWLLA